MRGFGRGLVLLLVGAACAPMRPAQAPEGTPPVDSRLNTATADPEDSAWLAVRDVRLEPVGAGRRVTLVLTRAADDVADFTTGTPPRLVVDLAGPRPRAAEPVARYPFDDTLVSQVRVGSRDGALRVVVDLKGDPGAHVVRRDGTVVVVDLGDTGPVAATDSVPAPTEAPGTVRAAAPAAETSPPPAAPEAPFLAVENVHVEPTAAGRRLVIQLSRTPDAMKDFTLPTPPRLVVDLRGPAAREMSRPTRLPMSDTLVSAVRFAANGSGVLRVVADLRQPSDIHTVRVDGSRVVADLGDRMAKDAGGAGDEVAITRAAFTEPPDEETGMRAIPAVARVGIPDAEPVAERREAPVAEQQLAAADPSPATGSVRRVDPPLAVDPPAVPPTRLALADPPPPPAARPVAAEAPQATRGSHSPATGATAFRGERISLDFKDADVQNVLRVLADVSRLNIIATDDVKGKVTLHLNDVPWDQALDLVLHSNRLEKIQEGNVVRISTLSRLKEEREALRAAEDAERDLEPLRVRYLKVNYARADEALVDKVKGVLTDRGSVTFDDRTNTVIVRDIPRGIEDAIQLVRELDVQSPQVLIEANIVEATEDFARALGVQWGYQFNAGPATGNPTGMNFPGTVDLSGSGLGRSSPTLGPTGGTVRPGVPFLADFPVPPGFGTGFGPGNGSALDLALGSIDGTQSLAVRLTALEEEGKGKVISRPRVITMNNVAATIQSLTILRVKLPSTGTVINTGTGGAAGTASTATEKINTGITLVVTPQVSSDGFVLLSIYAKSSQPDFTRAVDGIPNEISREANSNVLIRDAETVVLGGIFRQTDDDRESGLPYLRSIPALGWLFKKTLHNRHHEELLVFLTPRVVKSGTAQLPGAGQLWEDRRQGG